MAFKKGDPKPENSGRKQGSKNKVNTSAAEIMARYDVSGIDGLCRIAAGQELECTVSIDKDTGKPITGKVRPTFDQRQAAFKELAQYEAPKLKAVEHSGEGGGNIVVKIMQ